MSKKRISLSLFPNAGCTIPWVYTKKYNIKERVFNKINIDSNFQVNTLNDISFIQVNFCKTFRFDNSDLLLNGSIYPDNALCIKRVLDEGITDTCGVLSIVFGNFLTELNLEVRLVKATLTKYKGHHNHFFNILKWRDGREYIVDVAVGYFNSFYPVEIGGNEIINNNNGYRCRKLAKDEEIGDKEMYIFEYRSLLPNGDNSWKVIVCFDRNMKVSFSTFVMAEQEYRKTKQLIIYLLFDEGSYFLTKDYFLIKYHNGENINIPILSLNHLLEIANKYFKIDNFKVLKELFINYRKAKL
ncbi:hypothetical protein DICPUDRAFT_151049 [Dictyostelium purpureum]|uniref:Uncharacterized protein n=1 Tax=Dictyostelium purpureum TaxID=5786 RepID=F0ZHV6_DICPU|nr:uncharacterized protein DICPUDRAFT_151049 [Dictyostelium purpureum]EGC36477.1 hypothetical protein DICPUDRAFT_151049 [Dictyostelium purpureum]|eukprot:XP_003286990.1 hypothetical protein DICPUDRAFT_151049 [Dictyostelium purpureum]